MISKILILRRKTVKKKEKDIKEDEKIVRLHIGLEDPKDLIEDLRKSLKFIK